MVCLLAKFFHFWRRKIFINQDPWPCLVADSMFSQKMWICCVIFDCGQAMFLGRFGVYYRVFWRVMRLSAPDWWSPICLHHSINTQLPRAATVVAQINKSYFLVPMILCSSVKVPSPLYSGLRWSRGFRKCHLLRCWAFQQFQIPSHLSFTSSAVVVSWCQRHLEITSVAGELCWEMPKLR